MFAQDRSLTTTNGIEDTLIYLSDITVSRGNLINVPDDFSSIQDAIDSSSSSDTILVANGIYYENLIIDKNIIITSNYLLNRDPSIIDSTIIDGNLFGRIVTFAGSVDSTSQLRGFTLKRGSSANGAGINITNGNTPIIADCHISDHAGYGIYINSASPYIRNSKVNQCYGIGVKVDGENSSNVLLDGVEISNNNGRGLEVSYAIINALNCLIYGNSTTLSGGGIHGFASHLNIVNTTITANNSVNGGGTYFDTACNVTVVNSILSGNTPDNIDFDTANYPCIVNISYSDIVDDYVQLSSNPILNMTWGAGNLDIDPWFSDTLISDYTLHQFSPLIGAGTIIGTPDHDIINNQRPIPVGSNPDLGAYENSLAVAADRIIVVNSLNPTPGDYSIAETDSIVFSCSAFDPDGNDVVYTWMNNSINVGTDTTYTLNTNFSSGGLYTIQLNLIDNYGTRNDTTLTWNITVTEVDRPIITNHILPVNDLQYLNELDSLEFEYSGYDPDGNELIYSWKFDSTEVSTDSVFTLYTDYSSAGTHNLSLSVNDGFVANSRDEIGYFWTIIIAETDQDIVIDNLMPEPGSYTMNETDSLEFLCSAYDPDGNDVVYTWMIDAVNSGIDSVLIYHTDYETAGIHEIQLQITDNFSRNDTIVSWQIEVFDVDQPIVVDSLYPQTGLFSIAEGDEETFCCHAYDPDANVLEFNWVLDSISVSTDSIYIYNPGFDQAGAHELNLIITDNFGLANTATRNELSYNWQIEVLDSDQAIVVENIQPATGAVSIAETDSIVFMFDGYDPDGNSLDYLWKVDDLIVSTDSSFILNSDYNGSGEYFVTLAVTDNYSLRNSQLFIWYVEITDVDRPIVIEWLMPALGTVYLNETDSLNFTVSASDPDNNNIDYNWQLDSLSVSTDSIFTLYTDYNSAGEYEIKANISDGFSSTRNDTTLIWTVIVTDIDQPIIVDSIVPAEGEILADEGDSLEFICEAHDPDNNDLVYNWQLDGSSIGNDNYLIYNIDYESAGNHTITLSVGDDFGQRNQLNFQWDIIVSDVDQEIIVEDLYPTPGMIQIAEGDSIAFSFHGNDPDGNILIYQWFLDSLLVASDNMFNFVTDYDFTGMYNLDLHISDGYGTRSQLLFHWDIEVIESDQLIVTNSIDPLPGTIELAETESQNFIFSGYDPDGSPLVYNWLLDGSSVGSDSSYTYLSDYFSAGTHSVVLSVTDNFGGFTRNDTIFSWQLNVIDTDQLIVVENIQPIPGDLVCDEADSLNFMCSGYDPDGQEIVYSWYLDSVPVASDSSYTYYPDYESSGSHQLYLSLSDGFQPTRNDTAFYWNILVNDIDRKIVINELSPAVGLLNIEETETIQFSCSATDPDGNELDYNWQLDGTIVSNDSLFTYVTDYSSAGEHTLDLTVGDGFQSARNDTLFQWQIDVAEKDQPIVITDLVPVPGNYTIAELDYLLFLFDGYDPDGNDVILQWYLDDNPISEDVGFTYQTDYQSAGIHNVSLMLSDSFVQPTRNDTLFTWQITVTELDQAIIIETVTPDSQSIVLNEGEQQIFTVSAFDPDGETLQYNWLLDGLSVGEDSLYLFVTDFESADLYALELIISDNWETRNDTTLSWNIEVLDVDREIIVETILPSPGNVFINEGENIEFNFSGYDPDGNQLQYSWILDDQIVGNDSIWQFIADYEDSGTYDLELQVTDDYRNQLSFDWIIEVEDVDQEIIVDSIFPDPGIITISETDSLMFIFNGHDPDGNVLTYQWIFNEEFVSQDSIYMFITDYASTGIYDLQLIVNDSYSRHILDFNWEISVSNISILNVPEDFVSIQNAIIAAGVGDTVLVQPGIYQELISLQDKAITIASNYLISGDPSYIETTIIDGQSNNTVVTFMGVPAEARFCGFTVINGFSFFGAGVKCNSGSDLQIDHLKIRDNSSAYGGGMYILNSDPNINAIVINNNEGSNSGGGIYLESSSGILENLLIYNNNAGNGSAFRMINSAPQINCITVSDNNSPGAGVFSLENSNPEINSSIISYNEGVGIQAVDSDPTITYCNFYQNSDGDFFNCSAELGIINSVNIFNDPCDINNNIYFISNFENRVDNDYRLNQYALNIGAGDSQCSLTFDLIGNPRPQPVDSTPDIGCYESILSRAADGGIIVTYTDPEPGIISITELDSIVFQLDGYDLNGRDLDYVWFLNGISQSNEQTYTFYTEQGMAGNYTVTLNLDDDWITREGTRFDTTFSWNIHVTQLNQPIVVDYLYPDEGTFVMNEGETVEFVCDAYDPDGNDLDYTWIFNAEDVGSDSTFVLETDYQSAGQDLLTLYLTDETTRHDTMFIWNITVENVDQSIAIDSLYPEPGSLEINEGDSIAFGIIASDPDGNSLSYLWQLDGEEVGQDSLYTFISDFNAAGEHEISLNVSDSAARNDTIFSWDIDVINVDRYPVITGYSPEDSLIIIDGGVSLEFYLEAFDPDGDLLTFQWFVNDDIYSSDSLFTLTLDQMGDYEIKGVASANGLAVIQIWQIDVTTGVDSEDLPLSTMLKQNYPNPFNPSATGRGAATTIEFSIADNLCNTSLIIYNLRGQVIRSLIKEKLAKGIYTIVWDGKLDNGSQAASGIYLYRLDAGNIHYIKRMLMLK